MYLFAHVYLILAYGHSRSSDANKENKPATVKAELFVNVPRPITPVNRPLSHNSSSEDDAPLSRLVPNTNKRSSVVLPPSANMAMNNNYSSSTTKGDMGPPPPRRSATAGPGNGYESDPGRGGHSRGMSTSGGPVTPIRDPKGWGFEFLDHPPPLTTSNIESDEKGPESTHAEFNKMLVSLSRI